MLQKNKQGRCVIPLEPIPGRGGQGTHKWCQGYWVVDMKTRTKIERHCLYKAKRRRWVFAWLWKSQKCAGQSSHVQLQLMGWAKRLQLFKEHWALVVKSTSSTKHLMVNTADLTDKTWTCESNNPGQGENQRQIKVLKSNAAGKLWCWQLCLQRHPCAGCGTNQAGKMMVCKHWVKELPTQCQDLQPMAM